MLCGYGWVILTHHVVAPVRFVSHAGHYWFRSINAHQCNRPESFRLLVQPTTVGY